MKKGQNMKKMKRSAWAFLAVFGAAKIATAQVTVTPVIAMEDYVTATLTALGTPFGAIIAVFFAIFVVTLSVGYLKFFKRVA